MLSNDRGRGRTGARAALGVVVAVCAALVSPAGSAAEPMTSATSASYLRGVNDRTFTYYSAGSPQSLAGNEAPESFTFMKSHGVDVVRINILWEKIQPTLGGSLAANEVARLKTEIDRANAAGILSIINIHNFARYHDASNVEHRMGGDLTTAQFNDVWVRLSQVFVDYPGVIAYDLMNEPYDLDGSGGADTRADAVIWEQYSQSAVEALRIAGDRHLLVVEGVQSAATWAFAGVHPKAWIEDPLNRISYSAHQYFDTSGLYVTHPEGMNGNDYTYEQPNLRYSFWENVYAGSPYNGWGPSPLCGPAISLADCQLNKLRSWIDWLKANHAEGYVGEVGWPSKQYMTRTGMSDADATVEANKWNDLARKWFELADEAGLSVTYYSASGADQDQYYYWHASPTIEGIPERNGVFVNGTRNNDGRQPDGSYTLDPVTGRRAPSPIDTAYSQYDVLSQHPSR